MMTKIIHSTPLRKTNAPTSTSPIDARKTIVATTRTGLNMSLSCLRNPIRKPVPMREMIVPKIYSTAKRSSIPKVRTMVPSRLSTKPAIKQPMKPYKRVVFDKLRNLKAESPSKNDVSGTILLEPPASRLNHPFGMTKYYLRVIHKVFRSRFAVCVCLLRRVPCQQRSVADGRKV